MKKTARAHTNIALVKYWGKKNNELKIPQNDSISMTLDKFYTDTSYEEIDDATSSQFYLDGQLMTPEQSQRVVNFITILQERFDLPHKNFVIRSNNNVPTSAGLASSSSAFSALAYAFVGYHQLRVNLTEVSRLARLGSGSASRSVFGGFVMWHGGDSDLTSYAVAIEKKPRMDLALLAIEIDTKPKDIPSTAGMQTVVETSPDYQNWVKQANLDVKKMLGAIRENDFTKLGQIAEQNALMMHDLNLTATPSFTYFTDETKKAIAIVKDLRESGIECYVTIDAGPNVKVLTQHQNIKPIEQRFKQEMNNVNIVKATFGPGVKYLD